MNRHGWALATGVVFVGYLLLHLPASDVFDGFARRYGFIAYDTTTRVVFAVAGLALWVWLWLAPSDLRRSIRRALIAVTLVTAYALAMLAVNGIEAIHLPQYIVLALMLGAAGLGPESSWAAATGLGALDEMWQWQLLRRARPDYFDWNDAVLNGAGAALGVLIAVRLRRPSGAPPVSTNVALALLSCAAVLGLAAGPVVAEPFIRFSPAGRWYHLASAVEALLLLAVMWHAVRGAAAPTSASRAADPAKVVDHAMGNRDDAHGQ